MCELTEKYKGKTFTGYKVVARLGLEDDKNLYSIAMGTKYPNDGIIQKAITQNRMMPYFNSDILKDPCTFRKNMVGRTAAFRDLYAADELKNKINGHGTFAPNQEINTEVWKVRLSKSLMEGTYNHQEIVAGRHIKFLIKIE